MKVVVIGTGFVGGPLCEQLTARGDEVIGLGRTTDPPHRLDVLADPIPTIATRLAGADAVVVAYAPGGVQDRRALYVGGAERLLAAMRSLDADSRPRRLVVASSTSALPSVDGRVDETCEQRPATERGGVQRDAEDAWRDGLEQLSIDGFILRLAGLYGPGRELGRLYLRPRSDPFPGDGMRPTNLIHQDDAVAAFVAALDVEVAGVELVHVCDDDHTPRRVMVETLAEAAGRKPPEFEQPAGTVHGKVVDNAKMKRVLKLELRRPRHAPN